MSESCLVWETHTHLVSEVFVVERKFVCMIHSEAKHTETTEFGAEEGFLRGHARRIDVPCSQDPS